MSIEDLLPSARPKQMRSAFKVLKARGLRRLEDIDKLQPISPKRKKIELEKIDPSERWWI